jgi:hypothetical protein
MTLAVYEESQSFGQPVQLFKFTYGTEAGEYYSYTDHTEELTVDGVTYLPVPMDRDGIDSNGTLDRTAIKISTDVGTDLAEIFRVYPPSSVVSLVIRQGHVGDSDDGFLVIWSGRVVAALREKGELALTGEPISTSLRRPGLRANYQYGCRHVLYGPKCQADKASKTLGTTVSAISGAAVTLPSGWNGAFDPSKFLGGLFEWTAPGGSTNRRTILRVTGNVLSLSGIPTDLAVSDAASVVVGCNHKAYAEDDGDCLPLHNNILNFGGCRWIPLKNPVGTYNNYW